MKLLGTPFIIQNTEGPDWLVSWHDAITHRNEDGQTLETVSFTVKIPKRANLPVAEVQRYAVKRAIELLQDLDRAQT